MHDWFNVGYQAFLNGEYSEPVGLTERQWLASHSGHDFRDALRANASRGYVVDDNGTGRVWTFQQVREAA